MFIEEYKKFSEMYNILIQPQHKLWQNENFEFPIEKSNEYR